MLSTCMFITVQSLRHLCAKRQFCQRCICLNLWSLLKSVRGTRPHNTLLFFGVHYVVSVTTIYSNSRVTAKANCINSQGVTTDGNDAKILRAILDDANYNIANHDRSALETVIQWLMESNNTEL